MIVDVRMMRRLVGLATLAGMAVAGVAPPTAALAGGVGVARECQVLIDVMKAAPPGQMLSSLPAMARVTNGSGTIDITPRQLSSPAQRALLARAKSRGPHQRPIDCRVAFEHADVKVLPDRASATPEARTPNVSFTRPTFSADGKSALFLYGYWASMMGAGCSGVIAAREPRGHWSIVKEIPICPTA